MILKSGGLAALLCSVILAGCGEGAGAQLGERVLGVVIPLVAGASMGSGGDARTITPPDFSAQAIAQDTSQFMVLNLTTLGIAAPARIIADNGADVTWRTQAGYTASFRDGMLVATRGLGDDLMAAEAGQVRAALRAGGGSARRVVEFLSDQDQIESMTFDCVIVAAGTETIDLGLRQVPTRKFDETCTNPRLVFSNIYWLDSAGAIVQSRQFVSPTVAYLRSNRL